MANRGAPIGNQNAKRARIVRSELLSVLDEDPKRLREVCLQLIAKAMMGDVAAYREIRDTIDGKPQQAVTVDGDGEGGAVRIAVERLIVRAGQDTTNPDSGSI